MSEWVQKAGPRSESGPGATVATAPTPRERQHTGPSIPGRKKGTACSRCRSQKIRCDDEQPACSNCSRLGHPCVRPNAANNSETLSHVTQMEARLRSLEASLRRVAPDELDRAPSVGTAAAPASQQPSAKAHIALGESGRASFTTSVPPASTSPQNLLWPGQEHRNDENSQLDQHRQNPETRSYSRPMLSTRSLHAGMYDEPSSTQSTTSPALTTLSSAPSSQIRPSEPLAHEVGMLSLANSHESKYLGPSSGVPFARLIFSAIPQSQGLSLGWPHADTSTAEPPRNAQQADPFPANWTSEIDLQHFADAYFETFQPMYPFLDEDTVAELLERLHTTQDDGGQSLRMPLLDEVEASLSPSQSVQMFLIVALGARTLETRLSTDFSADRYLATAMQRVGSFSLHDSFAGMQTMLLLALSSFYFEDGPNAWFLVANIIASCQDLGLQRRSLNDHRDLAPEERRKALAHDRLRKGIFWSAYSLERTLAVVLGRPLTLRDEAIDIEFPGRDSTNPYDFGRPDGPSTNNDGVTPEDNRSPYSSNKRAKVQSDPFAAAQYSFGFDQITAEIKLMLHRVNNRPGRFPWPTNLEAWQTDVQMRCEALLKRLRSDLRSPSRRSSSGGIIRTLELKYHQCLMLLHRPSPAITRPSLSSWKTCYDSAIAIINISSELHRFSKLSDSWLTAHSIFVSGITFLYCLWVRPEIQQHTSMKSFTSNSAACTILLKYLAKTWTVAADAVNKFERLVHLTAESWKTGECPPSAEVAAGQSLLSMSQFQAGQVSRPPWQRNGDEADVDFQSSSTGLDGSTVVEEYHCGDGNPQQTGNFFNELGDMSSWFDLNWLFETTDMTGLGDTST